MIEQLARVEKAKEEVQRQAATVEGEARALREWVDQAEAAQRGAEEELAGWAAGSPIARAWRALIYRRGRP